MMNLPLAEARLSELFSAALDTDADGTVSLEEVLVRAGDRSYGIMLLVLAIPCFIPVLPPGTSGVVGALMILVALQLLFGRRQLWLPVRWRRKRLAPATVQALQTKGVALLQRIERVSYPRGRWLTRNGLILRSSALMVILLSLVLSSPMPFMNTLPALAIALIAVGLMNHDGYLLLAGNLLGLVVLAIVGLGLGTLLNLWRWVRGL
ncbi:MAG: exopolysaccharide biosynthesis protein [Fimbriimonadales bacterium]|nr:exopolysaccharide biosynthesis protein [Fimbriimonadales bacterium]